jgi:Tfp pilus assembly protein FimT
MVAVLVIVAVLAGVAVPAMSSIDGARRAVAARHLLHDLSFARQWAVATGTRTWVVLDPGAETWSVLAEDPAAPGRAGATVLSDPGTGEAYTVTLDVDALAGVRMVSADFDGGVEVGFDWLGRPLNDGETSLAAPGTVVLDGGHSVTVAAATGHVTHAGP